MEKTKHSLKSIKAQTFTILWAGIQAFSWGMVYLLLTNIPLYGEDKFSVFVMYAFVGGLVGALTGALQTVLVEQSSGRHFAHWVKLTAGASAVAFVGIQLLITMNSYYIELSPYLALAPLFVLPALAQWWSLREHSRSSWLWIAAHAIADMVFIMILSSTQQAGILVVLIPAVFEGILTGLVLFWLLERLGKPLSDNSRKMRYHEVYEVMES